MMHSHGHVLPMSPSLPAPGSAGLPHAGKSHAGLPYVGISHAGLLYVGDTDEMAAMAVRSLFFSTA
jgi:hypothetical protein